MEPSSKNDVPIDVLVSSLSLTEETTETLTSPSPVPTLPLDLIAEIFCRLPVELLLQLQRVSKSWKSLISDPYFAKKHLRKSTPHHHILVSIMNSERNVLHFDSPISSVFSTLQVKRKKITFPNSFKERYGAPWDVSSCDGILCLVGTKGSFLLCNPSIRTFKILPPLNNTPYGGTASLYGFGYDHLTNKYKVVGVCLNEVSVYTLGTQYSWRRIQDFPHYHRSSGSFGVFVSGSINWLTYDDHRRCNPGDNIVSLDLAKETYQKLSLPDSKMNLQGFGVLKDCLCITLRSDNHELLEVWTMKEFGNKESWTRLYIVPCTFFHKESCYYTIAKPLYIYEDNTLLTDFHIVDWGKSKLKLGFYDSENCTLKILKNQNMERDPII